MAKKIMKKKMKKLKMKKMNINRMRIIKILVIKIRRGIKILTKTKKQIIIKIIIYMRIIKKIFN